MSLLDQFNLATDTAFLGRCRIVLCSLCNAVADEDVNSLPSSDQLGLHRRRASIAHACVAAQDDYLGCFARLVALFPGISKNSPDADLAAAGQQALSQMANRGQ